MRTQTQDAERHSGPLNGIRVLDLSTSRGELTGRFLAELGAEVIKVEPPAGAEARTMPPFALEDGRTQERSLFWEAAALGKQSVIIDLATGPGRAQLQGLVQEADVLVESYDPGVMASFGLDFARLHAANPRLVYVSITPFGQTGPKVDHPAADITLQAAGGLVSLQGDWDRRPVPIGEPYTAAYHAGAQAAADTVIALNERERSGLGQHLDVSMQAAIVWILMNATGFPPNERRDPPGFGDERGEGPLSAGAAQLAAAGITTKIPSLWECADGWVFALVVPSEQRASAYTAVLRWADEVGALGDNRDLLDVDWATFLVDVEQGRLTEDPLDRAVDCFRALFRRVSKAELMKRTIRDNLFFASVNAVDDLLVDSQLKGRGFWRNVEGVIHPGPFAKLSVTPLAAATRAPELGAHQALLAASRDRPVPRVPAETSPPLRPRPFEGLKVADFAWIGVGPIVAKALADHGATVVHVESETRIDSLRLAPPFKGGVRDANLSQFFANFNTSKLSLALNLATSDGKCIAKELTGWADVVVESFTPGTMAKLGLDYETLSRDHPGLVMLSTCLRGQTGPEASLAGFGNAGAAISGLHSITGWPDRAPSGPWGALTDFIAPRLAVAALTAALYHHTRTGLGQYIDVSQVECGINFLAPEVLDFVVNNRVAPASQDASPLAFPNGTYQVAGKSRYVALAVETGAQWQALQRVALGPAFAGPALRDLAARRAVGDLIDRELRTWFRDKEPWSAAQELVEAGIPAAVVARPSDLYKDPQLSHRGFFTELVHSKMGPTPYDGFATKFSAIPSAPRTAAPVLGEHTDHVLRELIGLSAAEVAEAREAGILE